MRASTRSTGTAPSPEGLGNLYEGLLEKNAEETKSGAGQYFTPRPLIEAMVALVKPQAGERVQDPAVGTGGFLINADRYVKSQTDDLHDLKTSAQNFQKRQAFYGVELVPDVQRLALMNAMLHDIEGDILLGDTLGPTGAKLQKADVILTNPPFGTKKGGGGPTRDDITYPTSNKQLVFLQHIYRGLVPGGRAAVVLPDNVLFEEGVGQKVRADLMDECDLHTILRLPTGIFYAQGVKTNVLFFTRGEKDKGNTKQVWLFDMRTNMPSFGKRTVLTREQFADFETAYGEDPRGGPKALAAPRRTRASGALARLHPEVDREAGGQPRHCVAEGRQRDRCHALPEPAALARKRCGSLRVLWRNCGRSLRNWARTLSRWRHERHAGVLGVGCY